MDLGYVQYNNEVEHSMESKKKPIDAKLSDLFRADATKLLQVETGGHLTW